MKRKDRIGTSNTPWLLYIITLCVLILLGINGIRASKGLQSDEEQRINIFGYRPVVVVSGSMLPSIEINSISILQYCNITDIDIGDVLMYRHPGMKINITHRVIEKEVDDSGEIYVRTRGDNNEAEDNIYIYNDLVVGKLIKTYNWIAPYMSMLIKDGEVDSLALFQLVIFLAVVITLSLMAGGMIIVLVSSTILVIKNGIGAKRMRVTYYRNLKIQANKQDMVKHLGRRKGDSIRVVIAKILLARELRAFNEAVSDLEKAYDKVKMLGGTELLNPKDEVEFIKIDISSREKEEIEDSHSTSLKYILSTLQKSEKRKGSS